MKKGICGISVLMASLFLFSACDFIQQMESYVGEIISSIENEIDQSYEDLYSSIFGPGGPTTDQTSEVMTNAGKGLPTSENGVYNVDFTSATYVKNVTDLGYYKEGCPTLSTENTNPAVLVIPIEFSDATAESKGYDLTRLNKAFNGGKGETDYYSVHDYYYLSSYGKLDVEITVLDEWFRPSKTSDWYWQQTMESEKEAIGEQMIMNEALTYLSTKMDLTKFDSDGNGKIDAVVMINTLDVDANDESAFYWAYRYWNLYTDEKGGDYEYDDVVARDYMWASYQFLHETKDFFGNTKYTNKNGMNTYAFIHEFGHILGADDYYDTAYKTEPLGGYDVMDDTAGDHNAFTKFNYGWITSSRLIVAEDSVTVTLDAFSQSGDTILIANNWDEALGLYQEYYVVMYYTNDGLNTGMGGYFRKEGIVVYHVNASLYSEGYGKNIHYYNAYNNTDSSDPNGYGTKENLLELVENSWENYVFRVGDYLSPFLKDDMDEKVAYIFTVDEMTDTTATLTFTKNN